MYKIKGKKYLHLFYLQFIDPPTPPPLQNILDLYFGGNISETFFKKKILVYLCVIE